MNTFDPETHTYTMSGVKVPSPTLVLNDQLPYKGPVSGSEWYMHRGSAVHHAAAIIARDGEVLINEPDPDNRAYMEGCVASIAKFFAEVKPEVVLVEQHLFSRWHRFGGTLDLLCGIDDVLTLCDWKSAFTCALPYQLGAYALLVADQPGGRMPRYGRGIQYSPDGQYTMSDKFDLRQYATAFLALLGAFNVREKEGYHKEGGV